MKVADLLKLTKQKSFQSSLLIYVTKWNIDGCVCVAHSLYIFQRALSKSFNFVLKLVLKLDQDGPKRRPKFFVYKIVIPSKNNRNNQKKINLSWNIHFHNLIV